VWGCCEQALALVGLCKRQRGLDTCESCNVAAGTVNMLHEWVRPQLVPDQKL
jgi:hypothetical protein